MDYEYEFRKAMEAYHKSKTNNANNIIKCNDDSDTELFKVPLQLYYDDLINIYSLFSEKDKIKIIKYYNNLTLGSYLICNCGFIIKSGFKQHLINLRNYHLFGNKHFSYIENKPFKTDMDHKYLINRHLYMVDRCESCFNEYYLYRFYNYEDTKNLLFYTFNIDNNKLDYLINKLLLYKYGLCENCLYRISNA